MCQTNILYEILSLKKHNGMSSIKTNNSFPLGSIPEQAISFLCSPMHVPEIVTCKRQNLLVSFPSVQQKAFPHPQKTFRKLS